MFDLAPLKLQWKEKKTTLGVSSCLFSRGRVSLFIHLFDVELYASDWDIRLCVTKLNTVIEALFSSFLKATTFSALSDL